MTESAPVLSLPDPVALETAVAAGSEDECQRLMLRALQHGTDDNTSEDADDTLAKRTQATIAWFEKGIGNAAKKAASSLAMIEDALVDCLWLLGSTLTALPWQPEPAAADAATGSNGSPSKATAASGGTETQTIHPSVGALTVIVKALLSPTLWKSSESHGDDGTPFSNHLRFAQKLQENWFPILLERVNAIKVTTTATSTVVSDKSKQPPAGIPGNADDLMKRLRQYNTTTNYKQQKYNLLQEESEGYSKLLQHLCACNHQKNNNRSFLWQLVGTFELDPNRVLDLSLDVLDAKLQAAAKTSGKTGRCQPPIISHEIRWLLDVIRDCATDKLPALLRFKLRKARPDSSSLLETTALLVREDLMSLQTFVEDYFEPTLAPDLENVYGIFRKKERDRVLALSRVSLSGNTNKENPKQIELANKLKVAMGKLRLPNRRSSGNNGGKDTEEAGTESNDGGNGQILLLLLILIRWGEWELVKPMLASTTSSSYSLSSPMLSKWGKLCCLMPETFGSALLDVTEARIQPASVQTKSLAPKLNQSNTTKSSISDEGNSLPTISTMADLIHFIRSVSDTLSHLIPSGCIRDRPVLYCNLCRILRSILTSIAKDSKSPGIHSIPQEIFSFFETFLVPSLSLFPSNPALSTELWSVIELLPYDIRYKLYEGWKGSGLGKAGLVGGGTKPLPNVESEMLAGKAARYALKRLSKDNIRDMSRQLAKVTHSNPLVVFATILSQIESYDNMVEVMVKAQRFVNPLGLDVLGHCVLGRLSGTSVGVNRSRLKEDGVNVSQWLQSLETFAGELYKTRPSVEFRGILFYLMERLKGGNVMELGMLRTLLKVAGGYSFADYSPAASLNESQLDGRSGSVTLKRETMSFGIVETTNRAAIEHVRSVLQTDGLGVSLLILIAQASDRIIFDSGKGAFKDVKLVGNLYDTCQVIMSILLEFLTDDEDDENMNGNLSSSHISMYSSFLPSFQNLQRNYGLDMATAWLLCRPCVKAALKMESEDLKNSSLSRFELSEDMRKSYSDSLPESVWNVLTPQLVEIFYMASLGDIFCPEDVFTSQKSRVDKEIERIQGLKPTIPKNESDELIRLKSVSKQLDDDMKKQKDHVESTLKGLNDEKSNFFTSEEISREASRSFLMYCTYPRTTQSPDDAMYSAAIAFRLHRIWTPGFSIMHYLDELISIVSGALFGVTEAEGANLAILLWQTLKVVNSWRHEDGVYDKEVLGKPGSSMEKSEDGESSTTSVSHKDFIELYNKWQYSLADALVGCLKSAEYIHTRTGLTVLSRLVNVFPTGPQLGNRFLKALEPLQDENSSRPDIRASAISYGVMLVKARDEGKWVEEDKAAAKARADKKKEEEVERKKKIEQSFQELKRDNEKITAQIGNDDRRDRTRGGPRDSFNQDRRTDNSRQGAGGRDIPGNSRTGSDYSRMDRRGDDRDRRAGDDRDRRTGGDDRDRRTGGDDRDRRAGGDDRDRRAGGDDRDRRQGGDDRDRRTGGDDRDRRSGREGERSERDREDGMNDDRGRGRRGAEDDRRGNRDDGAGRDDGRWRQDGRNGRDGRDGTGGPRNPKRGRPPSRPPSPVDDRDTDRRNQNRPRNDRRGNRDDGAGQDDGRWRRDGRDGPGGPRNPKRSRPSSPVDDRDKDRANQKRPRNDEDKNFSSRPRRMNNRR